MCVCVCVCVCVCIDYIYIHTVIHINTYGHGSRGLVLLLGGGGVESFLQDLDEVGRVGLWGDG